MNFHKSVLLQEAVEGLKVLSGQKYIDATLGGGGHSLEIIKRRGIVLGIDQDPDAIDYVKANFQLPISSSQLKLKRGNFRNIEKIAKENGFEKVSGIIFDLGVSSHQIDEKNRGFSYQKEGSLDMRMDPNTKLKASDLINLLSNEQLSEIFNKFGEEPRSRAISSAIIRRRNMKAITNTQELVGIIAQVYKIRRFNPMLRAKLANRVFQALRIAVNDETRALKEALASCPNLLQPGGRLAIISFHSLEDRIVKDSFIDFKKRGLGTIITPKPVMSSEAEVLLNKRSKGAKLRIFEKL
ncbi:MAG: 16S rRNA (cytosine(1402)-N(4))-methyltransferase [Candidatus Levybacteria bacterium RBG_16_35_6]|nr:MAG: Ribosomal RNA small subunit methyltransferase H [Candidatus Levybacteria bacterium GW2011_GWA2_36_13]KKQ58533.1 MAG: Ribosomal RNA small subunit methyltransferase H [Microgenomates group bacterium GW2011_GWC1_38_14]KKR17551.1 MAG: Ribosomal RNA small subunit methyltransferase H [Candidatus Levybacteria bacterium GW2011_GWA1_39_32]OGH08459.1 MAG: 16S rRNA (cytosine(1402)-N(4))-methyltransferase [Candidatus Levybacteria bacterium RBG_16_35_6]OGH43796.1 MAG: 16S rRNA (cytosine(1402)-N(4))-